MKKILFAVLMMLFADIASAQEGVIKCLPANPIDDVLYMNVPQVRGWGWRCAEGGGIQTIVTLKSYYPSAACTRKLESFIKLNRDYDKAKQLVELKATVATCSKGFITDEQKALRTMAEKELVAMVTEYELNRLSRQVR